MKNNVVGTVISVIVLFLSLIILPSYFIGIIDWRNDLNICQTSARNFVDMVIDNQQITEKALSELNLSIASCTSSFTYEYYREEKVTNPGADGTIETSWVYTEVTPDTKWRTGDIVTIIIKQNGLNVFQRISTVLIGTPFYSTDIRLSGMVR